MRVEIWSDVVCPWCFIGKRRFERALEDFPHADDVDIVHRAFELNPSIPPGVVTPRRQTLMDRHGWTEAQVREMTAKIERAAAGDGIEFNLSDVFVGSTRDAHRILATTKDFELQGDVLERFYRAHFTERRSLFDRGSLVTLSAEAGLSPMRAREVLDSGEGLDLVETDVEQARVRGITAVPYFLLGGRHAISGAQPRTVFADAIAEAWDDTRRQPH